MTRMHEHLGAEKGTWISLWLSGKVLACIALTVCLLCLTKRYSYLAKCVSCTYIPPSIRERFVGNNAGPACFLRNLQLWLLTRVLKSRRGQQVDTCWEGGSDGVCIGSVRMCCCMRSSGTAVVAAGCVCAGGCGCGCWCAGGCCACCCCSCAAGMGVGNLPGRRTLYSCIIQFLTMASSPKTPSSCSSTRRFHSQNSLRSSVATAPAATAAASAPQPPLG